MTLRKLLPWALAFAAALAIACPASAGEIRIITDRTPSHLQPLFDYYEKVSGDSIKAVFMDKGMLERLETRPGEADLVITSTSQVLEEAKGKGLLKKYKSKVLEGLPAQFQEKDRMYFIPSYRARVIYYSKDRVKPEELSTYMDLASPKWKGKLAIRSGYHRYNLSLFCQMAEAYGMEKTKAFIKGLHDNLCQTPKGNDRNQVRAIYEGEADVAIANSYYMGIMLSREDQRAWALSANVFFPDQNEKGAFVLRSAAGLTKDAKNVKGATRFLEFLVGDFAQYYMANTLYVYPVNQDLPLPAVTRDLGAGQEGIKDGRFKADFIPEAAAEQHRAAIIDYLNEINFDNK